MLQQLVKKGANGRYSNVMPKSWIEAIKDKNTGKTLVEILQSFNMYFLSYDGNSTSTRCLVPTMLRKKGLWITYVKYDGNVYTEWYAADEIDDKSWGDSSNWRIGNNILVGDITISANGNWVINGTETEFKAVGEKGNTPLVRFGSNNKFQVSYNNGEKWLDISDSITNNLRIKKYIGTNESLPTLGIEEGTIYAKGPTYADGDTSHANPIYRLWVYAWKGDTLAWQDNGEFTSIAAGVVQEIGNSETEVMSQKSVTKKISYLNSLINIHGNTTIDCSINYSDALALGIQFKGRLMSDGSWDKTGDAVSVLIPITKELNYFTYVPKSSANEFSFIKSYNDDSADICSGRTIVSQEFYTVKDYKIPSDCNYIYICLYRGGTTMVKSIAIHSNFSYFDSKNRNVKVNEGDLDISIYKRYLIGGVPPNVYDDATRCMVLIPASNIETITIKPKEGWRIASSYYKESFDNPYLFEMGASDSMITKNGKYSDAPLVYGEEETYNVPLTAKTIRLRIRKEVDGPIDLNDIPDSVQVSVTTIDSVNKKRSRYAKLSILDAPTSCIRWDTTENKLYFPSSTVIWYGDNAKERFGYQGNFSINVPSDGGHNKLVFNPTKENISEKIYILYGEQQENEYHLCDIHLGIHSLSLPTEYYIVDGKHPSTSTPSQNNSIIYYDGNKIEFPLENKNVLSCVKIGINSLRNDIVWDGSIQYMQGGAIYGNYLFKIGYSGGTTSMCQVYDISNILNPIHVSTYYLGFTGEGAHANCCQFGLEVNDTGFPYLYTRNGGDHACCVEKVSLGSSKLVQTIKISISSVFPHGGGEGNAIIGDDGYLWYFGEASGYQYFAKLRLPSISEGNVTLTKDDVLDSWEIEVSDNYVNRTWQGGKVKGGRIYFLYGGNANNNRIYVVNATTHKLENMIPLSTIYEEVEDLDFHNNSLFIFLSSHTNGMYMINNL